MIRLLAVVTFLLLVGVCSYMVLDGGSYSTLVLCFAGFCSVRGDTCGCPSLEILSF